MKKAIKSIFGTSLIVASCSSNLSSNNERIQSTKALRNIELSSALATHCYGSNIHRIPRFISSSDESLGRFSYGFRYRAPTKTGAPTLVYLPGGPGATGMDTIPDYIPDGWGFLLTDPRGIGCNELADLPSSAVAAKFFQTAEFSNDVVAAIKKVNLSNYVIHGISYGTMVATVTTTELENQGVVPPNAVVLEGVLGKSFAGVFSGAEYIRQWDLIRKQLPADVLSEFDSQENPFGISSKQWSTFLIRLLPGSPTIVSQLISGLSISIPEAQRNISINSVIEMSRLSDEKPSVTELYRWVACREINVTTPKTNLDVLLRNGKLVRNTSEEGSMCSGIELSNPFDSAKYQFKTRAYYFMGESDVATPIWQGDYHFKSHSGPSTRILTLKGGHNSLVSDLVKCTKNIFASIAIAPQDFSKTMSECAMQTTITNK